VTPALLKRPWSFVSLERNSLALVLFVERSARSGWSKTDFSGGTRIEAFDDFDCCLGFFEEQRVGM
jgi:hypothetical protein